jgi:hypothetical protein
MPHAMNQDAHSQLRYQRVGLLEECRKCGWGDGKCWKYQGRVFEYYDDVEITIESCQELMKFGYSIVS